MTIHVNIGEAETRLSELIDAARRGEDVIIARAGAPQVRLVAISAVSEEERERLIAKRLAAIGMWKHLMSGEQATVPPSMTDEELEERWQRKFGPSA